MNRSKDKMLLIGLIVGYTLIILWYTLLGRSTLIHPVQTDFLWSYRAWHQGNHGVGKQVFGNIMLFLPYGFLWASVTEKHRVIKAALAGLILSCLIEGLQYILARGLFEFDDLFHNTLGALLGGIIYIVSRKILPQSLNRIISVSAGVLSVIIGITVCYTSHIRRVDQSARQYCFQIDDAIVSGDDLQLSGFAFQYNQRNRRLRLALKPTGSGESIKLRVEYGMERENVNEYFSCDQDYSDTGFRASGTGIDKEKEYEVLIGFGYTILVPTGVFIADGVICYTPVDTFRTPDGGAALKKIVQDGTLRVYRPDYHCWVYQVDNTLFWIAEPGFEFEEDGKTRIQFQLWTTQQERLPQQRLKHNWLWDNISGHFEDYEMQGDFGSCRVMKREIPIEYAVTAIATGYYTDEKWVWINCFRPIYPF